MSVIKLARPLSVTERILSNLAGLSLFLSSITPPNGVNLSKEFGIFTLRAHDVVVAVLIIFLLMLGKLGLRKNLAAVLILTIGVAGSIANKSQPGNFLLDFQGILNFFEAVMIFSLLKNRDSLRTIYLYVCACLWTSALQSALIIGGLAPNKYGFRSSYSGSGVSDYGISRLVTPTFMLSQVILCFCLFMFFNGEMKLKHASLALVPALFILAVAGTRTTLLIVIIPLVVGFVLRRTKKNINNRRTFLKVFAFSAFFLGVTVPLLGSGTALVVGYVTNSINRISVFFSSGSLALSDNSTFYRTIETSFAWEFINAHLFLGGGLGAQYSSQMFVNDDSWLGIHGNVYLHETFLWVLVKFGLIGLVVLVFWLSRVFLRQASTPEGLALKYSLPVILLTCFFWNVLSNVPDSLVFGSLVGLAIAQSSPRNSKDLRSKLENI